MFDRIRDLTTIRLYLENAYARREAFDQDLVSRSIESLRFPTRLFEKFKAHCHSLQLR